MAHGPKTCLLSPSHRTLLPVNEASVPETRQDGSQQKLAVALTLTLTLNLNLTLDIALDLALAITLTIPLT